MFQQVGIGVEAVKLGLSSCGYRVSYFFGCLIQIIDRPNRTYLRAIVQTEALAEKARSFSLGSTGEEMLRSVVDQSFDQIRFALVERAAYFCSLLAVESNDVM